MIIQPAFIVRNFSKKDILNIIKRKGVDILGSVRRARILEVYFPAGAKYIFNIGENENSIGEMWNSVSHGSDMFWRLNVFYLTLLDKFLQVFFLFFPLLQIRHITLDLRPYRFRVDFIWLSQLGECFVVRWKVRRMGSVSVNLNARFLVVYYSTKQTRSLHRVPV